MHASNGKIVPGYKSTYKRNETLTLFAALKVAAGEVIGRTSETEKRADLQAFIDYPAGDSRLHSLAIEEGERLGGLRGRRPWMSV